MKRICLALVSVWSVLVTIQAMALDPGETGGTFLKMAVGAAPVGMGEAYTALARDVNSVYWNPAGLVGVQDRQALFMHLEWFEGIRYENLAYAQPLAEFGLPGYAGISIGGLYTSIENRVEGAPGGASGWTLNEEGFFVASGPSYPAYDIGLILSYAYLLDLEKNKIALGASLRGLVETIDIYTGFGGGVDLGALYFLHDTPWYEDWKPDWFPYAEYSKFLIPKTAGLVAQNLGGIGPMREGGESSFLPMTAKAGIGYEFSFLEFDSLKLAADYHQAFDNLPKFNFGTEYNYTFPRVASFEVAGRQAELNDLALTGRLGYKLGGGLQNDLGALAGLSFGLGLGITANTTRVEIDYALVPYGILSQDSFLSSTHRVSLTVKLDQETGKVIKAAH